MSFLTPRFLFALLGVYGSISIGLALLLWTERTPGSQTLIAGIGALLVLWPGKIAVTRLTTPR